MKVMMALEEERIKEVELKLGKRHLVHQVNGSS
jgi:hypothetical protein